jgi:cyclopropane fatty-acyl-phospholipid synthase-like methyltransferase
MESQRLIKQANFVRPSTERVFQKAGLAAGMRVLDIGCGAGDVSFLAAELVGPTGSVVGIDVDAGVLAAARQRANDKGMNHVTFEQQSVDRFQATQPFDAVVGRFVLMYQADPIATLAHVSGLLKTGGVLVVQELDFGDGASTWPEVALWHQVSSWISKTFRRGGVHDSIGGKLYHLFRRAGLPGPTLLEHVTAGGGTAMRPVCENIAELVRSLLPRMEQFGIATASEVEVETLADRLENDACAVDAQITYVGVVGAWTSKQ